MFSSVCFSHSVVSDSLRTHGLQHTRLPCPSPTSGACFNSCPSSQGCHPTLLSPPPPGRVFLICRSSTGCLYLPVISFCYCFFSMLDHREFISSCCYKSSSPNSAFCIISESMNQFSTCGELYLFCCMPGNSNWEICMLILGF